MYYYIYKMTDPNTREFYIGRRQSKVEPELDITYRGSMCAWTKEENFNKEILIKEILIKDIETIEELCELESSIIKSVIKDPLNKNAYIPGKGFYLIGPRSEETRNRMSEASKGRKHSEKTKEKIKQIRTNQIHSEETKRKISESNKGKTLSEEHKNSLKKPKSEEHKEKMRGPRPNFKKPKEKIECPTCGKSGAPNVMYRFHFENCGIKQENSRVECPHCKKMVDGGNGKRWHFDNCKNKNC